MHELSIAQNIVEIVVDYIAKTKSKQVKEVCIDVGAVSGVVPETLEFAWEESVRNTIVQGAILKINYIEAKALCTKCQKEFILPDIYTLCPFCNNLDFDIIMGKELSVKSIKVL